MWRKTREPVPSNWTAGVDMSEVLLCLVDNNQLRGTDANRNFDFQWRKTDMTRNACGETYAVSSMFSAFTIELSTRKLFLVLHT